LDCQNAGEAVESENKITVYYDGACYICSREIDLYKRKDTDKRINFTDISRPEFDAQKERLDASKVQRLFHVRSRDGNILVGVDGFIAIWDELKSFNFLARLARIRLVRFFLDLGYKLFVVIRPYLPRKKCETDTCQI